MKCNYKLLIALLIFPLVLIASYAHAACQATTLSGLGLPTNDGPGTTKTVYSCLNSSITDTLYHLQDVTRSGITTELLNNCYNSFYNYCSDLSNDSGLGDIDTPDIYGNPSFNNNVWTGPTQTAAVDAHVYAGKTYDYLKTVLSRTSFDGKGGKMFSVVDDSYEDSAHWYGGEVHYALSFSGPLTNQPSLSTKPQAALDVVAHEWGHGVTENTLRGTTLGGGDSPMDEAFSDWFGIAVKHYYKASWSDDDWKFNKDAAVQGYTGRRSLKDPTDTTVRCIGPDYYQGLNWCVSAMTDSRGNCPPNYQCNIDHTNAGMPNKMFYLLASTGTHTHPVSGVGVQGIGIDNAIQIAYGANNSYWQSDLTFYEAMTGMVSKALDRNNQNLNANEVKQVKLAWAAVGVGDLLAFVKSGTGSGSVSSTSTYIPYSMNKSIYPPGDTITVTATPNSYSYFAGWSGGGCSGTGNCIVTMATDTLDSQPTTTVTAAFYAIILADFTAYPIFGNNQLATSFVNRSANLATSWFWKFGDGYTSSLQNPSHTYNAPGVYTVSLTASDIYTSNTKTLTNYITIQNCSTLPVRLISGATTTYYGTLQDAYNAAPNGAVIQSQGIDLTGNLNVNRSISVTLQGGYNCGYTAYQRDMNLKGAITTSAGTITVGSITLVQ